MYENPGVAPTRCRRPCKYHSQKHLCRALHDTIKQQQNQSKFIYINWRFLVWKQRGIYKGVGRKISRGGGQRKKRSKNSKKSPKMALLNLFQRGEPTDERPKNSKKTPKNSTFKLLSTIFVPCMKIQWETRFPLAPRCRCPWVYKQTSFQAIFTLKAVLTYYDVLLVEFSYFPHQLQAI